MAIPITLSGTNLGERHRYLNSLVSESNEREHLDKILIQQESSPVDRLFKIELASKHKHVDYILKNLQDEDMLYVSKALKCKWLLHDNYRNIINPEHLENTLYPNMITIAVNKMKHWIHLNLKNAERCKEFYDYYLRKDDRMAFHFLFKCPEHFILTEFPKKEIIDKITPHYLKMFCEKSPGVATIFFDKLITDKEFYFLYLKKCNQYISSIKCTLKLNPVIFFNIIEQHLISSMKKLGKTTSKYILTHHKEYFEKKAEFYTSQVLNVDAIAQCLSQEECEKLTMKLAQALYLKEWFNYKNVEPFIKKLDVEKRSTLKKKIFVDKDFEGKVNDWPYKIPTALHTHRDYESGLDIFTNKEKSPFMYDYMDFSREDGFVECCMKCSDTLFCNRKPTTLLDRLFDEYRFKNFNQTLFDLRKKITCESSSQNRMYMFLVLISKSGGVSDHLKELLTVLMQHYNEPPQVRAAVVRSLVKRACIWRVTDDIWNDMLTFAQGLGLDGKESEVDCNEGLHAVVIRELLLNGSCTPAIKTAFLKRFSTFTDYSLSTKEKEHINKLLLLILLETANAESNVAEAASLILNALDILGAYKIKFERFPELITSIKHLVRKDKVAAEIILLRLYNSKIGRKELFYEMFHLIQTGESYMNALKHDNTIISVDEFIKAVQTKKIVRTRKFLQNLNIYFNENRGLASNFLTAMKESGNKNLIRPLAYLIGDDLKPYILELDNKNDTNKTCSAMIRANAHLARPVFDIGTFEWSKCGAKLIANKVLKCKTVDLDRRIKQLLLWKRTAKLAIILAQRTKYEADVFATVTKIRPTIALKSALKYFRRNGDQSDTRIWDSVKTLIEQVKDSIKTSPHLRKTVKKVEDMPLSIRSEYAIMVYKIILNIDFVEAAVVLSHINVLLPEIDDKLIENILHDFLNNRFTYKNCMINYRENEIALLFVRILGKYLLLCKTEEVQNQKLANTGNLFFERMSSLRDSPDNIKLFMPYLNEFLQSLKYTEVFLNKNYVSSLPVMEKVVEWMQGILPKEKYFKCYVPLHLTMIFHKAVRQCVEQVPEVFTDVKLRKNEGTQIMGKLFGKYIGHEAKILTKNYFDSVVIMYAYSLQKFMYEYFDYGWHKIGMSMVRGILEAVDGVEVLIAVILYKELIHHLNDEENKIMNDCLQQKKCLEMQFFMVSYLDRI